MTGAASPRHPLPQIDAARGTTGLVIYRASRLEALLAPLRDLLAATWPENPLQPQTVIAAHPGIKQWLTGALARRMGEGGIVANLDVVLPSTWIDRLAQARLGEQAVALPRYQRAQLRWNLHEWLGDAAAVPGLDDPRIGRFLHPPGGDDAERARRRYQLADRLAKLYSQYLIYRADWLEAWAHGKRRFATANATDATLIDTEARLLAPLWRHAVDALGPHRAEVMKTLVGDLRADGRERAPLHVFGVSHLAPMELEALRAYAEQALVALYLPDPCRDYWGVLDGVDAAAWRTEEDRLMEAAGEGEWWRPQRHQLLSRWGRMGQHFFSAVAESNVREDSRHWRDTRDDVPANRLQRVQESIRRLDEDLLVPGGGIDTELRDASLRMHACHTPKRELEVLRDAMLDARAAGIAPGEMLVMAPDIRRYLPLIPAVFGEPGSTREPIPFHMADVPASSSHPLFAATARLLRLPASRITAPEVLDLLSLPDVARRFGLQAGGLAAVENLLAESRVAWSLDPAHRAGFGVPGLPEHGFAWALDRMIAGHLFVDETDDAAQALPLPDGSERLPLPGVEGEGADAMAALDGLLAVVQRVQSLSTQAMSASRWSGTLVALCEQALRPDTQDRAAREAWDTLLQLLRGLHEETAAAGVDPLLHWSVVQERTLAALEAVPERQPFLLGGATFCGMVPQRAIPFRFIAVLGLDEGEFPRTPNNGGLDLMARLRRIGDREQRSDDRYLFLETLMSARDRLHLSWIGEGVGDGQPRNPAAPLAELMAMLERADELADARLPPTEMKPGEASLPTHAQTRPWQLAHPLQPFDARYFDGSDARLYTFDARQAPLRRTREGNEVETASPIPADEAATPPERILLRDLVTYFRDPARYLLKRQARADLDALADARLLGDEPLEPRLPAHESVARRLFRENAGDDTPPDWLRLSGRLPSGSAGEAAWQHEAGVLRDIRAAAVREGIAPDVPRDVPIDISLDIESHSVPLQGTVRDVFPRADGGVQLVGIPVGHKGLKTAGEIGFGQRLPIFIDWLALRVSMPETVPVRIAMLCRDASDDWAAAINHWDAALQMGEVTLDDVRAQLARLAGWLLEAPRHPLRWFPSSAQAAAAVPPTAHDDALAKEVQGKWLGKNRIPGERDRAPGAVALLAQGERFDAGSPALQALADFARQVDACMNFATAAPVEGGDA